MKTLTLITRDNQKLTLEVSCDADWSGKVRDFCEANDIKYPRGIVRMEITDSEHPTKPETRAPQIRECCS